MRPDRTPIPFFTDNDVPDGVGVALLELGHKLIRLREILLTNSPDEVVATTCREHGLVLVTHNVKHFRAISQKYESKHKEPDRLCRVLLECQQVRSPMRIRNAISLIEAEWDGLGDEKRGLQISIADKWIRTYR